MWLLNDYKGSRSLIGVQDLDVYPVRGQTIHVYAPSVKENAFAENADTCKNQPLTSNSSNINSSMPANNEITYVIPRPGLENTILIGGTYQSSNWDLSLCAKTAAGIFERCAKIVPALKEDPRVKILAHGVGLRPARKGGPRVEAEWVETGSPIGKGEMSVHIDAAEKRKMLVVHAYGFAGAGYQGSWGAAAEAVKLLKEQ